MNTFQSSEYRKKSISNDHKTGVGAICVDDDFIYYSTYETCENGSLMYPLRKYNHKEKEKISTCVVGFDRIRGIAKDKENNIYVVDSGKWRVVKFDSDLNPEQKTCPVSTNSQKIKLIHTFFKSHMAFLLLISMCLSVQAKRTVFAFLS